MLMWWSQMAQIMVPFHIAVLDYASTCVFWDSQRRGWNGQATSIHCSVRHSWWIHSFLEKRAAREWMIAVNVLQVHYVIQWIGGIFVFFTHAQKLVNLMFWCEAIGFCFSCTKFLLKSNKIMVGDTYRLCMSFLEVSDCSPFQQIKCVPVCFHIYKKYFQSELLWKPMEDTKRAAQKRQRFCYERAIRSDGEAPCTYVCTYAF